MTAKTMAAVLAEHHMSHADWDETEVAVICHCGVETVGQDDGEEAYLQEEALYAKHLEAALSAAGFGLVADAKAEALEELTAKSPRLPNDVRSEVFEAIFDVADKFNLPLQNMGPRSDLVEIGDVCGDVERRIVSMLRARAASLRGDS